MKVVALFTCIAILCLYYPTIECKKDSSKDFDAFFADDDDRTATLLFNPLETTAILIKDVQECKKKNAAKNVASWQCQCCMSRGLDTFPQQELLNVMKLREYLINTCGRTGFCTENVLNQTKTELRLQPNLDIVGVAEKAYLKITLSQRLNIPQSGMYWDGSIIPTRLPEFLSNNYRFHKLADPFFEHATCMKSKGLRTNTGKSIQMTLLDSTCNTGGMENIGKYLVLEKEDEIHECFKLSAIANMPGMRQFTGWSRVRGFPTVALPLHCGSYPGPKSHRMHYLSFMPRAPGKAVLSIVEAYSKDLTNSKKWEAFNQAYIQIGRTLSNLQQMFSYGTHDDSSSRKRYLGDTIVHGDLHMANVFYDVKSERVTIIDSSGFYKFQAHPFCDVFKLVMHPFRRRNSGHREYEIVPEKIRAKRWFPVAFHFIEAYVLAFAEEKRPQVSEELREMFNDKETV